LFSAANFTIFTSEVLPEPHVPNTALINGVLPTPSAFGTSPKYDDENLDCAFIN
jgi:hypothetical protein